MLSRAMVDNTILGHSWFVCRFGLAVSLAFHLNGQSTPPPAVCQYLGVKIVVKVGICFAKVSEISTKKFIFNVAY